MWISTYDMARFGLLWQRGGKWGDRQIVSPAYVKMATTASAQNNNPAFQCTVNASVTPALRAEGITEKTGDLVLNCTGGTPVNPGQLASGKALPWLTRRKKSIFRSF